MRYPVLMLVIVGFSSCAIISKQYYYAPSVTHQSIKNHYLHSDFKMVYSQVKISNNAGDSIGTIATNNGIGQPLLIGPFVPVIPVGGLFLKRNRRFEMDVIVNCNDGYFMPLAVDSVDYKIVRDSLKSLRIATVAQLNTKQCYMVVNDTLKVPLRVSEFFMGGNKTHGYSLTAAIPFRKVNSMRLVTGNGMLDSTLKNISFKRKSRFAFDLLGPGY